MLARIFTEPEIRTILRRYDPKEKWQLDTERSYMYTAIWALRQAVLTAQTRDFWGSPQVVHSIFNKHWIVGTTIRSQAHFSAS